MGYFDANSPPLGVGEGFSVSNDSGGVVSLNEIVSPCFYSVGYSFRSIGVVWVLGCFLVVCMML